MDSGQKFRAVLILSVVLSILGYFGHLHRYVLSAVSSVSNEAHLASILQESAKLLPSSLRSAQSDDAPPLVVAHVVSLIKCSKSRAYSEAGFLDAAAVLRHSIHKQSVHTPTSNSKYSYKMYAIIHTDCSHKAPALQSLGYTTLIKDAPVLVDEIKGEWYRNHVEAENCCGSKEFIKLYAYTLTDHPITVHWDMDVAILQPMDDLFDAMMYPHDSPQGRKARSKLELQHPNEPLPDRIDAYFTRDVTSAQPWEKHQGVQGGFLVSRPDPKALEIYIDFIKEGNYVAGRSDTSGWGGLGYGGFQGAMAYQGAVAYYYDQFAPNTAVELNGCRWNQVVADVIWRGPSHMEYNGTCREYPKDGNLASNTKCEDCRATPMELVKTVHYTACKKPWECQVPHPRVPRDKRQVYRLSHLTNITTCMALHRKWFELRDEFERDLEKASGGAIIPAQHDGEVEKESFLGYCKRSGGYIPMNAPPDGFDMKKVYGMQ